MTPVGYAAAVTDAQRDPASGSDVPPTEATAGPAIPAELAVLRSSIDNIDAALVHILAERFKATLRVGRLKAELDLPPSDPGREERQIARLRGLAHEAGLDPAFAEKFLNFIVAEVIRHHEAIAKGEDPLAP